MDHTIANVMRIAGVSLEEAITMATVNPARILGTDVDTLPRIEFAA